jgi:drug/metabolite transporter (DMT)-like permease
VSAAVHLALVLVQLLFASLAIVGRVLFETVPAGAVLLVRITGAAAVMLTVQALSGRRWITDPRELGKLAVLGVLGVGCNQGFFLFGLQYTTATNATILVATVPAFTVLGSLLLRREPASALKLGGIAAAAAGTVWLIGPDRLSLSPDVALGNALIVIGMVAYSVYLLNSRPVIDRWGPLTVSTYVMLFGAIGVLPVSIPAAARVDPGALPAVTWALLAYVIVFPTIVTYFLNVWALGRASSNLVAVYVYLQPVFTALVAPLVLEGEGLTPRAAAAGLLIFAGVGMVIAAERRQRHDMPAEPAAAR